MDKHLARTSSQRLESLTCRASFNSLVTAKHFGPRFLYNQGPDFIAVFRRFAHSPLLFKWVVRKIVINYNGPLFAVDEEFNSVTASLINFFRDKDPLYAFACFSKWADAWKKVTVSTTPLFDVVGSDFVVNNEAFVPVNFLRSFPNEILPLSMAFRSHHGSVENRSFISRKCVINPVLLLRNDSCVINLFKAVQVKGKLINRPCGCRINIESWEVDLSGVPDFSFRW